VHGTVEAATFRERLPMSPNSFSQHEASVGRGNWNFARECAAGSWGRTRAQGSSQEARPDVQHTVWHSWQVVARY
jgi:hypothetical protein